MEELQFSKGMQVEVCSDEDGLRGAWFEATILRPSTKRHKVYVEYKNLTTVKGSNLLKEFVNEVNLRPVPPREANRSFNSNDEVDAYYNDGWWEGVVIQVLEKENSKNRYLATVNSSHKIGLEMRIDSCVCKLWEKKSRSP
ncbi:hypothetical protein ACHQM5_010714 [Ranunculus cassubicifolius]